MQRIDGLEQLADASAEFSIRTAEEQTRGFGRLCIRSNSRQRQLYGVLLAHREKTVQHVCIARESLVLLWRCQATRTESGRNG